MVDVNTLSFSEHAPRVGYLSNYPLRRNRVTTVRRVSHLYLLPNGINPEINQDVRIRLYLKIT